VGVTPPQASRFAYGELLEKPTEAAPLARGSDGHITIPQMKSGLKSGDPFNNFHAPSAPAPSKKAAPAPESDEARTRFSNSKSISSAQFHNQDEAGHSDHAAKISQYSNAKGISSAQYFNERGSEDMDSMDALDITATELMSKLSMQAQADMAQLKNIASSATDKVSGLANKLLNGY